MNSDLYLKEGGLTEIADIERKEITLFVPGELVVTREIHFAH
jgi:hypothetical protein